MPLTFRKAYWDDLKAREAFKNFILDIHGLDFTKWESRGYWDAAYTPFSFFQDDQIISSVCIYLLDAIIERRPSTLVQISGVGTHKDWRRQGLSQELTERGLVWARGKHEGIFLFADEEAIPYYEKCGFNPLDEVIEFCLVEPVSKKYGLINLDSSNSVDLETIYGYAKQRTPISNRFSILSPKLLMFHVLYTMRDKIYEIPDLDCIVFFDRDGDCMNIYDILGEKIPTFDDLYPYLTSEVDQRVNFHFHPDKLGLKQSHRQTIVDNNVYIKGDFPLSRPVFPYTSRA